MSPMILAFIVCASAVLGTNAYPHRQKTSYYNEFAMDEAYPDTIENVLNAADEPELAAMKEVTLQAGNTYNVYLFDPGNQRFLSRINYFGTIDYIEASKQNRDTHCLFKMSVEDNNQLSFVADNNKYLSRVLYNGVGNFIQPNKGSQDKPFTVFDYDFKFLPANSNKPGRIGAIALRSDQNLYWKRGSGTTKIQPISGSPVYFEMYLAA